MFLAPQGYNDTITNFNPSTDTIDFENTMTPADFGKVAITADATGNAVLDFDGNSITLAGVQPGQLTQGMFLFNRDNPALQATQAAT